MKMKSRLAFLLLILLASCQPHAARVAPVITNDDFEDGWHLETTYWTPEGGPFHDQYQEITPPESWTAWWYQDFPCTDHSSLQGRPEVRVISTTPDPSRVHSGDQAVQFFTFWRCHRGGLYQQVAVELGRYYTVQAYGHSWFANCDSKPHYHLPLDYDCDTELGAHDWLRIGIDPFGGIDPAAPSVEWSAAQEIYGEYGDPLRLEHVEALSDTVTVFFEADASHPLKHCDVYWDDVSIWDSSYQMFLPYVVKEK